MIKVCFKIKTYFLNSFFSKKNQRWLEKGYLLINTVPYLPKFCCFADPERKVTEHAQRRQHCRMAGARVTSYITEVLTAWHRRNCAGGWLVGWVGVRGGAAFPILSIKLYIT